MVAGDSTIIDADTEEIVRVHTGLVRQDHWEHWISSNSLECVGNCSRWNALVVH